MYANNEDLHTATIEALTACWALSDDLEEALTACRIIRGNAEIEESLGGPEARAARDAETQRLNAAWAALTEDEQVAHASCVWQLRSIQQAYRAAHTARPITNTTAVTAAA